MEQMAVKNIKAKVAHFWFCYTQPRRHTVHHPVEIMSMGNASICSSVHKTTIIMNSIMSRRYRWVIFPSGCNTAVKTISRWPRLTTMRIHHAIMPIMHGRMVKAIFFWPLSISTATHSTTSHRHLGFVSTSCMPDLILTD